MAMLGRLCTELTLLPGPSTRREALPTANRSACASGAGGWTGVPSFHIQDSHRPGNALLPAQVTSKQDTGLAQLPGLGEAGATLASAAPSLPGERGLEKDLHGPLFVVQSVHPEVGRIHRVKLRTPDVLAGPLIS